MPAKGPLPKRDGLMRAGLRLPEAPGSIQKGMSMASLLGREAVDCLAGNLALVWPDFDGRAFRADALKAVEGLELMDRGRVLARTLRVHLPPNYGEAVKILIESLTDPLPVDHRAGLQVFFYLPHSFFIAEYGLDAGQNGGVDPLEISLQAQYELTRRFTAEFSIRPFLIHRMEETLGVLRKWTADSDGHVRRLCSEGSRPRLPWGIRLPALMVDPAPALPILEALKDDGELYVRRSVANHLGDIGKDHPELLFELCESWLEGASRERKWLIRHALRYPAKHGMREALRLRVAAR